MEREAVLILIGQMDEHVLAGLPVLLQERFGYRWRIGERLEIPEEAYHPRRRQYLSEPFLRKLGECTPSGAERVLGISGVDLYTPGLNFIFGQADGLGRVCLISTARLRQEFYGLKAVLELFRERVIKEAVHELGHTVGLGHCSNPKCVMFFSNTLRDTDRKSSTFCDRCRKKLAAYLV